MLAALAGCGVGILAFVTIDPLIDTPVWARAAALATLAGTLASGLMIALRWLLHRPGVAMIAANLRPRLGENSDRLLCAAELLDSTEGDTARAHLARRAASRAIEHLLAQPAGQLTRPERTASLRWAAAATGIATLIAAAWIIFPAPTAISLTRLARPSADVPPYASTRLSLALAGSPPVPGGQARLVISAAGVRPAEVAIELRTDDRSGEPVIIRATPSGDGTFHAEIQSVSTPMRLMARAGRARSPTLRIVPDGSPRLITANITITPPEYTRQPVRATAVVPGPQTTIEFIAGSSFQVDLLTNVPLAATAITATGARRDSTIDPLARAYSGTLAPGQDASLACASLGIDLRLHGLMDTPPTSRWAEHECSLSIEPLEQPVRLIAQAEDDFPFAEVALVWSLVDAEGRWQASGRWPVAPSDLAEKVTVEQVLSSSLLAADSGELIIVRLEATEGRPAALGGPRTTSTPWRTFRAMGPSDTIGPSSPTTDQLPPMASASSAMSDPSPNSASQPRSATSGEGSALPDAPNAPQPSLPRFNPERDRIASQSGTGSRSADAASSASSSDGQLAPQLRQAAAPPDADPVVLRATPGLRWRFERVAPGDPSVSKKADSRLGAIPPGDQDLARRYFEILSRAEEPKP